MPYVPSKEEKGELDAMIRVFEEPYHDYWFHLGKFIHSFAQVEAELLYLLIKSAGLSKTKAGVLFHAKRQEATRIDIINILKATKQHHKQQRLEKSFNQIAAIANIRNNLVHWGAQTDWEGSFIISNVRRKPLKITTYTVTIDDFRKIDKDLTKILFFLKFERDVVKNVSLAKVEELSRIPWQYKPLQRAPRRKTPSLGHLK
ncbi:MAG: hypothetical protein ACLPOA_17045 [Methylocella sp.]